jgi:NAD(P)-dependent dehydrogenase (short-subunit alcohol dehydrogenase family)
MSGPSTVLVIGASRGIGLALVQQIVSISTLHSLMVRKAKTYMPNLQKQLNCYPSANVYATARDVAKASDLQSLAALNKGKLHLITADVMDPNSIKAAAAQISQRTDSLDHVIYNAGILRGVGKNILEIGIEPLKENLETNVFGAYYSAVEFTPFLVNSKFERKSLVLMSSNFGSIALADTLFQLKKAAFGTDFEPTAMYNISKVDKNHFFRVLLDLG